MQLITMGLSSITIMLSLAAAPQHLYAAQKPNKNQKPAAVKVDSSGDPDGFVATSSTKIDFSDTTIDGKMKAPDGFMLQGQQSNSLSQMVKLRSNFRNELNNSRSATKALVK
jgi:hypothetical protein